MGKKIEVLKHQAEKLLGLFLFFLRCLFFSALPSTKKSPSVVEKLSSLRLFQEGGNAKQCGLSGAGGSDYAEHLALLTGQGNSFQNFLS